MPGDDHRTLCVLEKPPGLVHSGRVSRRSRILRQGPLVITLRRILVNWLYKNVQRNVDIHRTRPTVGHECECLAQSQRQHVGSRWLEAAFHVGAKYVDEISLEISPCLLKGTSVPLLGGYIAGDVEHRRGIGKGSRDRENKIG